MIMSCSRKNTQKKMSAQFVVQVVRWIKIARGRRYLTKFFVISHCMAVGILLKRRWYYTDRLKRKVCYDILLMGNLRKILIPTFLLSQVSLRMSSWD